MRKNEPRDFLLYRIANDRNNLRVRHLTRSCRVMLRVLEKDGAVVVEGKPPDRIAHLSRKGWDELVERDDSVRAFHGVDLWKIWHESAPDTC